MYDQTVTQYLALFPDEKSQLQPLISQLARKGEATMQQRTEYDEGHATGAAFIVSEQGDEILLIDHRVFHRLLQPGGHTEPEDSDPLQTAYREIEEEVGLPKDVITYQPIDAANPLIPIDLNAHFVAANAKRNEPGHYHYDFRYLFRVPRDARLTLQTEELDGLQWVSLDEFAALPDFGLQAEKIQRALRAQT